MMEKFIALPLKGNKQTTKGQYSHPLETVPLIYIPCQLTGFFYDYDENIKLNSLRFCYFNPPHPQFQLNQTKIKS